MTYQLTTLGNGLRVASDTLEGLQTVTLAVTIDVGSRYERREEGGIAHLLEHMAFKGTKTRDARQIAEAFDDIGGILNAHTSAEHTVYYAKVKKEDLGLAAEVIGDILLNSVFDEKEMKREREVIAQEIAMNEDTPDELVYDLFHGAAFPDQPLGRPILGKADRVKSFVADDLRRFMAAHYHPSRMIISAAGAVDHDALVTLVQQYFPMEASASMKVLEPARYVGKDARREKTLEQLHIMFGFEGVSVRHPDYYACQLLASVLGGGMSSRLFQEVREKRGLAYSVYAFNASYAETGTFGVYAATGAEQAHELMPVLVDELKKLTLDITENELKRVKNQHKASLLMSRESTSSVAEWIGRHLLVHGEYRAAEDLAARIDAVTRDDVMRAATGIIKTPLSFSALGSLAQVTPYETLVASFR